MSHTPAAPPPDTDTITREACLGLVHRQLALALTGSLAAAVLVFIALNNDFNLRAPLTLWLLALGASHGLSLLSLGRIRALSNLRWRRRAYLLIYATGGLIWGLLGLALLSFGLGVEQLLLVVLALVTTTGGVMAGGVGLFAIYPAFLLPALLPLAGIALALGGSVNLLLTGLLVLFGASTLLTTLGLHRTVLRLLRERAETAQRLTELSVNNRRLQREVDDYRRLRKALSDREVHYRTLLETMDCGVYMLEGQHFVYANPAWENFCGHPLEELQTLNIEQLIHPDDRPRIFPPGANRLTGSPETEYLICRLLRPDGSTRSLYLAARTLVFQNRLVTLASALPLEDRSPPTSWAHADEEVARILGSLDCGVIATDLDGRVSFANPAAETLCGRQAEQIQGQPSAKLLQLLNPLDHQPLGDPVRSCLERDEAIKLPGEYLLCQQDRDSEVRVMVTVNPLRDWRARTMGSVVSLCRRHPHDPGEPLLAQQAQRDPLTGLLNRQVFLERLHEAIDSTRRYRTHHVLCHLDLDRFLVVNDRFGQDAGDALLRGFALSLLGQSPFPDALARLDGDSFAILFRYTSLEQARTRAETLCQRVRTFPWRWGEQSLSITASLGLAPITADSRPDHLLPAAELACQVAKQLGRDRVYLHTPGDPLLPQYQGEMRWLPRLRAALAENRLRLYCQSVIPLDERNQQQHGELLLRLVDESEQLTGPAAFLPAAERYHLMPLLDRWVVEQTLALLTSDHPLLGDIQVFGVNLSGQSLSDPAFHDFLLESLDATSVERSRLCFEITETAAISNLDRAVRFIQALRERGCSVALDDFGSGLSSFTYLKRLPVNYLKIDGLFIRNLSHDRVDQSIVDAINRLAHALGLRTVAEFAGDEDTLALLQQLGVDYAQGFAIAEPIPVMDTPGTRDPVTGPTSSDPPPSPDP